MTNRRSARSIRALVLAAGLALSLGAFIATPALAQNARQDAAAAAQQAAENIPVRKITLYRSGVGYFERAGTVSGESEIQLRFNTDQINDILKSMVLLDLDGGRIDSVSYGSKEPLSKRLASFGVNISSNPSIPDLLGQLRGAPIKVVVSGETITGTILGVEQRIMPTVKEQQPVPVHHLNLVTPTGLRSLAITEVSSFEILDKELAAELNKALATLAEYRADRTKTVDLRFSGTGSRRIVVGYVHEMPVWKTSYRLVLPEKDTIPAKAASNGAASSKGEVMLQGWAIVENTTDQDWDNVNMALVSGRPVSFQMDLYEPLFTFRPFMPVPTIPGVMPRSYAGGTDRDKMLQEAAKSAESYQLSSRAADSEIMRRGVAPGKPASAPAPMDAAEVSGGTGASYFDISGDDMADYAAQSQARAGEVGEVFQYQLEAPVSIERQRSAMIPILTSTVAGRRVSIFNIADGAQHPMRGVEITNDSNLQLLPGPISVFDGAAYAGDAQIGHIPQGDKRLLAYSVDLDVNVLTKQENDTNVLKLRIVDGMFEQTVKSTTTLTYTFDNKDLKRARTIVIEHPRGDTAWQLVNPKKPDEETQTLYRFSVQAEPGKIVSLPVVGERIDRQSFGVTSIDMPTILSYHKSGKLSDKVLEAVRQVAQRQAAINESERQINELNGQTSAITQEQARIRENMARIDNASQLYGRYMTKLNEQETKLEEINDGRVKAQAKITQQREELNTFLRALNVE